MVEEEADTSTLTLDDGTVLTLIWNEDRYRYEGTCPKCGGTFHHESYDDGDGRWDECYECRSCNWSYWI